MVGNDHGIQHKGAAEVRRTIQEDVVILLEDGSIEAAFEGHDGCPVVAADLLTAGKEVDVRGYEIDVLVLARDDAGREGILVVHEEIDGGDFLIVRIVCPQDERCVGLGIEVDDKDFPVERLFT